MGINRQEYLTLSCFALPCFAVKYFAVKIQCFYKSKANVARNWYVSSHKAEG